MEFQELLKKRHSIRAYMDKPVEKEKIDRILEAAFSAPSAGNLQAYKIVVVKDKKAKEALYYLALEQDSILQAPAVLVFFADANQSSAKYGKRGAELYCILDAAIAATYAQLEAANLGLGCVWVGAAEDEKIANLLGAKEGEKLVAILPIGYPAEPGSPKARRGKKEIVVEL